MILAVQPDEVERFRSIVARRLGLQFEDAKLGSLAEVLGKQLEVDGRACQAYLDHLENHAPGESFLAIAQELTVAETYFFRHLDQLCAFSEVALPERIRAQTSPKRLRILSAGCASGEEAYSLAILAREALLDPSWELSILGIDINPAGLAKATRGRFSTWALRETPPELRRRWFRVNEREHVLDEAIRSSVMFEQSNLVEDDPKVWQAGAYDIVFCRNVIMYFTPEGAQRLVARIARSIAPGGYLFLGHAENLRGYSNDFNLKHTHSAFYYQRKPQLETQDRYSSNAAMSAPPLTSPLATLVDGTDTWVDAIRGASERIRVLTEATQGGISAPPMLAEPVQQRWDISVALELLKRERFGEALSLIEALPPESAHDTDVLLLHAVLLTHSGNLTRAEEACRRLLAFSEMNAGAHYLLALCSEGAGDRQGATDHDQVAAYLDPSFAMPRLHLGLLARRIGNRDNAQQELEHALSLLQREDASRQVMFGGGFSRDALIALCRAELLACGGRG